ncbi:MAG TPA: TetR/AcrR family transcriptional regulator [Acidobacteriaceae bacterium]|jgi:AcrR family transcriptional regulator|nr:TetR/AcrR family transcriptional regulator [Acidobacteriaceae bacterium]
MSTAKAHRRPSDSVPTRKNNRKAQIVAAAEALLNERGLAAVTTRAIAEAVPCSEGAIYVHFPNRLQLILTVFEQALGEMLAPLRALESEVGTSSPRANLLRATKAIRRFHLRVVPMLCSMFAEADLLAGFRDTLAERQKGPEGAVGRLAGYIAAEQSRGRISAKVDPQYAGAALMAGSFFGAFHEALLGQSLTVLAPARLVEETIGEEESEKARAASGAALI